MKQTLPELKKQGRWLVKGDSITCELVGQMNTGEMVWQDTEGNQYTRIKVSHRFHFVRI